MALSKYLARDKSTIDESIGSREAITAPGLAPATDALLLYQASTGKSKKSPLADIVSAGTGVGLSPGTSAFFRVIPTGWTRVTATYTDGSSLRIVDSASPVSFYTAGGIVENILTSTTLTGNISTTNSGGGNSFSPSTLSSTQIPEHRHNSGTRVENAGATYGPSSTPAPAGKAFNWNPAAPPSSYTNTTSPTGSGTSHTHNATAHTHPGPASTFTGDALAFDVKYVDFALATKD